ncbi:MAG TPA: hypothetical protein VJ691_11660 [Vicinamibacterales bacterium]|nr:hypothetical protein [Vicinamibacterales bacterium]
MRKLLVCAWVLTAGLGVAACDIRAENGNFDIDFASGKATDTWSRTYTVQAGGRFELINVNGRITAEPTDGKEIIVEGRRTAKAHTDEGARERLSQLEIREEVGGSTVRVESRPPRMSGFGGHEIEWTVKIPKGLIVDLRTVNGGVRINGLSGEIYARSTNGGVKGSKLIVDKIEASVTNGGVDIELGAPLDSTDLVELSSVNGGVTLALPAESKATIAARAVNGGVRVSDDLNTTREEESQEFERRRRFNGTMNGGGARVSATTTNGGVRITRAGSPTT